MTALPAEFEFRLRSMFREDLARVEALERRLFPDPWPQGAFEAELNNPVAHTWVAVRLEGGREADIIGYLVLWVWDDAVEIASIAVAEPYQGRGVGSALLAKAEATARRLGKRYVYLDVRLNNTRALNWYLHRGFRVERRLPRYYRIPPNRWEDGLRMVKTVEVDASEATP